MLRKIVPMIPPESASDAPLPALTEKQQAFVEQMLISPTIKHAAEACEITPKTASLWLRQPAVASAIATARRLNFDEDIHLLLHASRYAVKALLRNVSETAPPGVQVAAARTILQFKLDFQDVAELGERLAEVEALLDRRTVRGWTS